MNYAFWPLVLAAVTVSSSGSRGRNRGRGRGRASRGRTMEYFFVVRDDLLSH